VRPVLEQAKSLGFLGPGPVDHHIDHAVAMAAVLEVVVRPQETGLDGGGVKGVDLGSGGGVPGLVLASVAAGGVASWALVESMERRSAFLEWAVAELHLEDRVSVQRVRAEELGRTPGFRAACAVVVARSFGPPAVTAECAAPLLLVGGALVVSEPPGPVQDRWPASGLVELGLELEAPRGAGPTFAVMRSVQEVGSRYPRRVGIPAKRPLF